ncbi:TPR/sulfotransferase domain-containing protein [Hyphomonas hirschiana VP5]|nr:MULTISPECIES: sulfotransferase [Hyphomonas]KCZ94942.1 TPR/sulfotransferase domain-containing protein [Hyphomonas hirschiana VP5]
MTDARQQELLTTASRLRAEGRVPEAITAYQALLSAYPALPDSWYNLGWLLRQAGRGQEALAAYDEALSQGVKGAEEIHLNRAAIFSDLLARPDDAKAELLKAVAANPSYAAAYLNLGNLHEDLGERAEAKAAYDKAHAINPGSAVILSRLAGLGKATSLDDPMIAKLRALIAGGTLFPADLAVAHYALGRLYDSCGAYDAAAQSFAAANAGARIAAGGGVAPYELKADLYRADQTGRAFVSLREAKSGITEPDPQPVFILGMFRSGSTLVEQIIGAHSKVTPAGELGLIQTIYRNLGGTPARVAAAPESTIQQYAEAYLKHLRTLHPGASVVTDKHPENFWQIGLIRRMFPNARIINTVREPLDNLISVWGLHLDNSQNYGFTPQDIASRIHAERRMMIHWNRIYPGTILSVKYEDVIRQPEQEVRRVLDFLGLPFEPACLEFHKASGPVKTASVWQVREALHDRSIGRWKHYETYLRSLPSHAALDALLAVEQPGKPA